MGRAPCCDKANVKKGPWSPEEDSKLKHFIEKYGTGGNWIALPQKAGLRRCGKSCRLRWLNYLRPNIKHGEFSDEEDRIICTLFFSIGSRWSIIASHLPGRTDNDIKNYWNTKLKKKLLGIPPSQRKQQSRHQGSQQEHHHLQQQQQQTQRSDSQQQHLASGILESAIASGSYVQEPKPLLTGLDCCFPAATTGGDFLNGVTLAADGSLQIPLQQQYQMPTKGYNNSTTALVAFGGEPSCSSSKEMGCENGNFVHVGFGQHMIGFEGMQQHYSNNGFGHDPSEKLLLPNGHVWGEIGGHEVDKGSIGMWGGLPLEYGYEEIKELISPTHGNDDLNASTTVGSKSQGRPLYHF